MKEHEFTSDEKFPDELISAYLDDELSPADRTRVEEQLMDSAAHRQLFEELKSLRHSLKALPKQTLDDDFASRVLQRAEQQLLEEPADAPGPKQQSAAITLAPPVEDRSHWRGLMWSVAAMAAAIMLIVFSPMLTEREQGGVAINDFDDQRLTGEDQPDQTAREESPQGKSAEERTNKAIETRTTRDQVDGDGAASSAADKGHVASRNDDHRAAPPSTNALADNHPSPDALSIQRENASFGARPRADANHATSRAQPQFHNEVISPAAAPQVPAAGGAAAPEVAGAEFAGAGAGFGHGSQPADAFLMQRAKESKQQAALGYADMTVVSVDVTPDALSRGFMDQLLAKHKIQTDRARAAFDQTAGLAWAGDQALKAKREHDLRNQLAGGQAQQQGQGEGSGQGGQQGGQQGSAEQGDGPAQLAQAEAEGQAAIRDELAKQGGVSSELTEQQRKLSGRQDRARRSSIDSDVDVVVVVATQQQITDLLEDIQSQQQDVLAVAYDQPKGAWATNRFAAPQEAVQKNETSIEAGGEKSKLNSNAPGAGNNSSDAGDDQAADVSAQGLTAPPESTLDSVSDPKYRGRKIDGDEESFRGIARRLHLPENFQRLMPLEGNGQSAGEAPSRQPHTVANSAPQREAQGGEAYQREVEHAEKSAQKSGEEPLVRMLFVLRAVDRGNLVSPARVVPPASDAALEVPASGQPVDAAEVEAAPAGAVDE